MNQTITHFPVGKLPHTYLESLLERYTTMTPDVIVGARIGEDAAVIDIGEKYLLAKTDPITFATEEIGYYAININANDIACMGGIPRWFLASLLLPEGRSTEVMIENIFHQLSASCKTMDIAFCGGHTEITSGIDRPIVVGQMLGDVAKDKLVKTGNAIVGDDILLTKGIAIEAISIIAREKANELTELFSPQLVEQSKSYLYNPGISVLRDAQLAVQFEGLHAMHDPTEGGLAGGLFELARAASAGIQIEMDMIDILPECKLFCDVFNLEPLGMIASGSLLITCDPSVSHMLLEKFEDNDISACKIGKMMPADYGLKLITYRGEEQDMPYFQQDEIAKIFDVDRKEPQDGV